MSIAKRNKLIYTTITQYVNAGKKNYHNEYTYSQDMVYRLRKNLEDSLSIRYISKSQGFECSTDKKEGYKASNAVCSMYSKLPRKYENNLGTLKKLKKAVILVARTSESDFKDGDALSRLLFDIYIVNGDNATFLPHGYPSDVSLNSINKKDIYSEISPYKDVASYLKELGYKHVVYVAKNPYTSNLIEKKGGNTELYLMNESVLNSMAEAGIYVYPIYFHKSKVQHDINRLFQDKNGNKLDISTIFTSIEEYKKNDFEDMEGIVPFAKIFTSSKANGGNIKGDANYSSLMTYLTLKGMYSEDKSYNIKNDEILEDREIREDILNILLALHASNNSKSNNEVLNIKSNPFEDDETAVWESSKKFFKVNQITYRFNYYAFSMLLEDYINDVLKDKDC
jgi:hypothetical protein